MSLESGDQGHFCEKIIVLQSRGGKRLCTNLGGLVNISTYILSAQQWPEENDEGSINGSSG